jgi:hypothetical protein
LTKNIDNNKEEWINGVSEIRIHQNVNRNKNRRKLSFIADKTIGEDIFPYIPGDRKNNASWESMFKKMGKKLRSEFDKVGKQMPKVILRTDKIPINRI